MTKNRFLFAISLTVSIMGLSLTACTSSIKDAAKIISKKAHDNDFRDSEKWGKVITKPIEVSQFSHIYLAGNVDIKFTQGDSFSVEAYGNEKAIDANDIRVEGNALAVSKKEGVKGNVPTIKLLITAPSIESVDVAGAGDIVFKGETELAGDLDLTLSGAGDIDINKLKCNDLTITISGAGDVTAKKIKSEKATIKISGAGDIDAAIRATDISLTISGAGDADLDVQCDNLIVQASGTGDVDLKGECVNLTKSSSGMSSIDSRKLTVKNMNIK
ncbi:MAG: DUF2807 domain-containing protein [Prevotellaceae bacterium]|nr:DUF2807 domain-containing protein [Prevotellaceae bacterium]